MSELDTYMPIIFFIMVGLCILLGLLWYHYIDEYDESWDVDFQKYKKSGEISEELKEYILKEYFGDSKIHREIIKEAALKSAEDQKKLSTEFKKIINKTNGKTSEKETKRV